MIAGAQAQFVIMVDTLPVLITIIQVGTAFTVECANSLISFSSFVNCIH